MSSTRVTHSAEQDPLIPERVVRTEQGSLYGRSEEVGERGEEEENAESDAGDAVQISVSVL